MTSRPHNDDTRSLRRPNWTRKLVKYLISSMGGIVAETILIWILAQWVWPKWTFGVSVVAPTLGFELCLLVNYSAVRYFVWRDRKPSLWRFHISNASVYCVKMLFLLPIYYLVDFTIVIANIVVNSIVVCNIIAMALAGMLNFVLNDKVVFRTKRDTDTR